MIIYLILSSILYAIPFIFSHFLWWLIFLFPIPLLSIIRSTNLSFIHGYMWGIIVFSLHLSSGIAVVIHISHEWWLLGFVMGIAMILYQALFPGLLFWITHTVISYFSIRSVIFRVSLWVFVLAGFIHWVDQYCMWIFGIKEGYPLIQPLILLAQKPELLLLLPIFGKHIVTLFFLLVSVSFIFVWWYRNCKAILFVVLVCGFWIMPCMVGLKKEQEQYWYSNIKTLPYMIHSTGKNPIIVMHVLARHIREMLAEHKETTVIIMPESALNIVDCEKRVELLCMLNEKNIGKPLHIVFGTCRLQGENYYNSLHWIYNGELRACFDKKHAMLMTERLPSWMNYDFVRNIYFKDGYSITRSVNDRITLPLFKDTEFIPYICSELFFTDISDTSNFAHPIIVIINDTLLIGTFVQNLLLLLTQFKAIQCQRDIIFVSYGKSVFINKQGTIKEINE